MEGIVALIGLAKDPTARFACTAGFLLTAVACSFDFSRQASDLGGAAVDAAEDTGATDDGVKDAPGAPPDLPSPITLRMQPGTIAVGTGQGQASCIGDEVLVAGGGSCGDAGLLRSIPYVPDAGTATVKHWVVYCGGGEPTNILALCASGPMAKEIKRVGATMGNAAYGVTAPCASPTPLLVGGGCSCAAGALRASMPDRNENRWVCRCTAAGLHKALAFCAPSEYRFADKTIPSEEDSASASCSPGVRLSGGGEVTADGGFLRSSTPETGEAWRVSGNLDGVTAHAICFEPP